MSQSALRAEIEAQSAKFMAAAKEGDARSAAANYAENAWLLAANTPMVSGKAEIEAFWEHDLSGSRRWC